jgi:hypothetical protein
MRAPTIPKNFNFIREGSVVCGFEQKSNRAVQKEFVSVRKDKGRNKRGEPGMNRARLKHDCYTVVSRDLLERRSVKLVPIVEVVQVHRVLAGGSVVLQTGSGEDPFAGVIVVVVSAD